MGLFGRKKAVSQADILEYKKAQLDVKKESIALMQKSIDNLKAQMSSHNLVDQFYTTGIKQGKYAGLTQGNNNSIARRNSRIVHNESPVAQAMVTTFDTLTVGSGLMPESQPMWDICDPQNVIDGESRKRWKNLVEHRYKLWAKRKNTSYENDQNRLQQEQRIFHDLLIDGEYFEIYRYSANTRRNPMTIQIVRPEDVKNPSGSRVANGNDEEDGIEYDNRGRAVAYHVYDHRLKKTVRVLRDGARSGRVFVNHVKLGNKRRGVGILASIVTELMKLGDYEVLELQAAVVNALYAVWVKSPEGNDEIPTLTRGITKNGASSATENTISADDWINDRKNLDYSEGGLIVDALPGGYEVQSHDTKRPNVNFGAFMDQVKKNLASARGIPVSVLDKQFANNYSASRGELILAWYEIEKYRTNQSYTNDLVYKMWLWGEIINGKVRAAGFLTDEDIMDAWCNVKWIGNQRPDIDPLRSVQAHILEQDRGFRSGRQITPERGGGDYDENLSTVNGELARVAENQRPFAAIDVDLEDQ
jgi:lambda family phage portal protein